MCPTKYDRRLTCISCGCQHVPFLRSCRFHGVRMYRHLCWTLVDLLASILIRIKAYRFETFLVEGTCDFTTSQTGFDFSCGCAAASFLALVTSSTCSSVRSSVGEKKRSVVLFCEAERRIAPEDAEDCDAELACRANFLWQWLRTWKRCRHEPNFKSRH